MGESWLYTRARMCVFVCFYCLLSMPFIFVDFARSQSFVRFPAARGIERLHGGQYRDIPSPPPTAEDEVAVSLARFLDVYAAPGPLLRTQPPSGPGPPVAGPPPLLPPGSR